MQKPLVFNINQAKVVLYPIKGVRSAEINVLVRCGSWYEKPNELGYFHFLEHMLFHGTKNMPSTEIMMKNNKENGFYTNAYTSGNSINFYLSSPDVNLNQAIKTVEEIIFYPIFPSEKIGNELNIVAQELKSKWDRPNTRFFHQIDEIYFGKNHIYTRDNIGTMECLEKVNSQILHDLHQKYFQPQNTVISIVGHIKSPKKIIDKLTKILNRHSNTFKSKITYPPIKPAPPQEFIYHDKPEQETIYLTWITKKNQNSTRLDKISQRIFSYTIGNSVDSLLFKTFRLKYGLVYDIKSYQTNFKNYSTFEISCQIDPSKHQKFFEIFNSEFKNLIDQVTPEKFQQTIKYTNLQSLMSYDSVREISNIIINEAFNYKKIYLPENYIKLSKKISYQKTIDFFKSKLTTKNRYVSIMTPIKPEQ